MSTAIRCEKCGETLDPKKAKWLELSATDGNYYVEIPKLHISQGAFSFGTDCATKQIKETISNLNLKNLKPCQPLPLLTP